MSEVLSARGRAGQAKRTGDPKRIEGAYRDLAAAKIAAYIEKVVAEAPPLTAAQRDRLAILLRTAPEPRTIRRPAAVDHALAEAPDHIALADGVAGGDNE